MEEQRRKRLFKAIKASYESLRPFREEHRLLVKRYAGHRYNAQDGELARKFPRYINLINQAIEAYTTMLVGPNPQAHLTAVDPNLKPFAKEFGIALNNLADEIELGEKLSEWIRNAFFSVGIMKVHVGDSGEVIAEGDILMDPGQPYCSVVGIDDWVHDSTAKSWSECKFQGDLYQMALEDLKAGAKEGRFNQAAVSQVKPRSTSENVDRTAEIGRDVNSDDADFEEMVDLIDVYIPRDRRIYTFYVSDRQCCECKGPALQTIDWTGEEIGPYKKLGFATVPENVMPVPLASHWLDLDTEINNGLRKTIRQARRSRTVTAFEPSAANDAKKLKNATDGELVEVQNIQNMQQMQLGQVDGGVFAFTGELIKIFDRVAGNLQALLGLGTSADTVGQEKLIHGTVGRQGDAMQVQVVTQASKIFREIGQMLWDDEFKVIPGSVSLEGFPNITADVTWTPGDREGVFGDYKIQCDVYSLRASSPAERMQMIEGVLQRMIVPLAPFLQQQGGTVDVAELVNQVAELLNLPRIRDIVKFTQQPGMASPRDDTPKKSPVSNRTYTRRNVSGDNGQLDPGAISQSQQPSPAT